MRINLVEFVGGVHYVYVGFVKRFVVGGLWKVVA